VTDGTVLRLAATGIDQDKRSATKAS